jgi:predicted Fe-Mo cluster-binding NifX family protein
MKIAVTSTGTTLESEVDPRFGRCEHILIVDPETTEFEALENTGLTAAGGAGIGTGQLIVSKGVNLVLTGNCGPNAQQVLSAAGIKIVTDVSGRVRDATIQYNAGRLKP